MKIILDSSWNGLNVSALDAELKFVASTILRDDVEVKPGITDDGHAYLEILTKPAVPEVGVAPEILVVEVNGKYQYLAYPVVGPVKIGDRVDVPGEHEGAHWQGEVTDIIGLSDWAGDVPRLVVNEVYTVTRE